MEPPFVRATALPLLLLLATISTLTSAAPSSTSLTPAPRAVAVPQPLEPTTDTKAETTTAATETAPVAEEEGKNEAEEEAEDEEETGRAANGGDKVLRALSDRLYESCVQKDHLACLGLKVFYAAARFAEAPEALAQISSRKARLREATADRVLVGSAAALLSTSLRRARESVAHEQDTNPEHKQEMEEEEVAEEQNAEEKIDEEASDETPAEAQGQKGGTKEKNGYATDRRRASLPFSRKMVLPLLIGVVLKLGSLIPLILGKLTLVGTVSLMSSKLSLLILLLMSIRKWMGGGDSSGSSQVVSESPYYSQPDGPPAYAHSYPDSHAYESQSHPAIAAPPPGYGHPHVHMAHPGALHAPYRRVYRTYHMVRGRQLGGDDFWIPRTAEDMKAEEKATEELAAETAAVQAEAETEPAAESVIEGSDSADDVSSTVEPDLSDVTDNPSPATPLSLSVSAPAPDGGDAVPTLRRRGPQKLETATNGFSVSNEDTASEVRRLDEVEGRIVAL